MKTTKRWLPLLLIVLLVATIAVAACTQTATVTFVSGNADATGTAPNAKTVAIGETINLPSSKFNLEGYQFDGWTDGSNTYQAGDEYTVNGDVTFTAMWKFVDVGGDDEHVCSHVCNECGLCTDDACNNSVCSEKCGGHTIEEKHTCNHVCEDCGLCTDDTCDDTACENKCLGHEQPPVETDITAPFNGVICHASQTQSGATIVGTLSLFDNGQGYLIIENTSTNFAIVESIIRYTLANGTITITSAPDSNIQVPAYGTVNGRTVSLTLENRTVLGTTMSYAFESTLVKLSTTNMYGANETYVNYYPVGAALDLSNVELAGHALDKVVVNGEDKTPSWLNSFTSLNDDATIQFVWKAVETVEYTVTYQPGEGVGDAQTENATSAQHKLHSVWFDGWEAPQGKSFAGWLIDGTLYQRGDTITLTGDVTAVAQWVSNITVTLVLGSGATSNLENAGWENNSISLSPASAARFYLPYGSHQMGSVLYVSRTGFTLAGWLSSVDGQTYQPGQNVALTEDVTFTAVWKQDLDDTFDYDGTYLSENGMPDLATVSGDVDYNFIKAVLQDTTLTLYPKDEDWAKNVKLTFNGNVGTGLLGNSYSVTVTITDDTMTVVVKVNTTICTGIFVLEDSDPNQGGGSEDPNPDDPVLPEGINGFYSNPAGMTDFDNALFGYGSYEFNLAEIIGNTLTLSVDGHYGEDVTLTWDGNVGTGRFASMSLSWYKVTVTANDNELVVVITVNGDTFTAIFTKVQQTTVHVTFEKGDGDVTGDLPEDVVHGFYGETDEITLPSNSGNLAKVGYKFVGWMVKNGDDKIYKAGAKLTVSGNVTIIPAWEAESGNSGDELAKLIDYAGTKISPVAYGFTSLVEAGDNAALVSTVSIFKIEVYYDNGFYINHYRNSNSMSSTAVALKDETNANAITNENADNQVVTFKYGGVTISLEFSVNNKGQRTLSVTAVNYVAWTAIGDVPTIDDDEYDKNDPDDYAKVMHFTDVTFGYS